MRTVNSIQPRWRAFLVAMVSAVVVVATSPGAQAAVNYTPGGGPALKLVGTSVFIKNVPANQTVTCSQFGIAGQTTSPGVPRALGERAADLDALNYSNCTNLINGSVTLTSSPDWELAVTGSASGSSWPVRVDDISLKMTLVGCYVVFEGAVSGTFNTATQRMTPTSSTMVITQVVGGHFCVILDFLVGDQMDLGGYFTNVPPAGSGPLTLS